MILRDAIKYMEVNGSDFITDSVDFASLQRSFMAGSVPNDFTERYEGFIDNLARLWLSNSGLLYDSSEDDINLPSTEALINMYCKVVFPSEVEEETETVFFSSSLIKKKTDIEKENKTLELLSFLGNNEINISQYLELEIEVIYKVLELIAEKKKEEKEKERRRKRKGL